MNIAICDDEKAIREQIKELIEKTGLCPELFETGDSLLAAGKRFDIVFLDIQMEGMGGIKAVRTLRQSGAFCSLTENKKAGKPSCSFRYFLIKYSHGVLP